VSVVARLAHVSDLHFGCVEPGAADALAGAIEALAPDALILSGDFTMRGSRAEFREAGAFVRRFACPVVATPGNHDIPAYALHERFFRPLRRYRRHVTPWTKDRLRLDGCAVLTLNTARPWDLSWNWSHGRFSRRQIEEADAYFAHHEDAASRVLVAHHPFFVPEDLPGFRTVGRGDEMLSVLARRRVSLVLTGHLHRQDAAFRDLPLGEAMDRPEAHRVHLVQAGTATSARRRDQPNAFNWLELREGRVELTAMVLGDDGRFEASDRVALPTPETGEPASGTVSGG